MTLTRGISSPASATARNSPASPTASKSPPTTPGSPFSSPLATPEQASQVRRKPTTDSASSPRGLLESETHSPGQTRIFFPESQDVTQQSSAPTQRSESARRLVLPPKLTPKSESSHSSPEATRESPAHSKGNASPGSQRRHELQSGEHLDKKNASDTRKQDADRASMDDSDLTEQPAKKTFGKKLLGALKWLGKATSLATIALAKFGFEVGKEAGIGVADTALEASDGVFGRILEGVKGWAGMARELFGGKEKGKEKEKKPDSNSPETDKNKSEETAKQHAALTAAEARK